MHPSNSGNFHFLSGIEPYSSGAVADEGFAIAHAVLHHPLTWQDGFARIDAQLQEVGRPRAALCDMELLSPTPFTRQRCPDFNPSYCELILTL